MRYKRERKSTIPEASFRPAGIVDLVDTSENCGEHMAAPEQARKGPDAVSIVVSIFLAILILVVVGRMLFPPNPVDIVIQADPSGESFSAATALAMGERMGQSAEWTIATVLVIGSALIGLNWYQGDRRYQRDMDEIDERIAGLDTQIRKRLDAIEFTGKATLAFLLWQVTADRLGSPGQVGYVGKARDLFRTSTSPEQRQLIASMLVDWAKALHTSDPTLPIMGEVPALRGFLPDIQAHFPEMAMTISDALAVAATGYRSPD